MDDQWEHLGRLKALQKDKEVNQEWRLAAESQQPRYATFLRTSTLDTWH